MKRFIGVRHNRIFVVSNAPFVSETMTSIIVPDELEDVSPVDIITQFRVAKGVISRRRPTKPIGEMKIAFVGNWKMRCGISSYVEKLWPTVAAHIGDTKFFVERNETPTGELNTLGSEVIDSSRVIPCWTRGESLVELTAALKEYNPDIIWIQHEFGLWPNARHWLSFMSQLADYRVIVTMHSVFHHRDKIICEAAMPEIVVHLDGAKTVLKDEKQIYSDVYVIPHGCSIASRERLWNFYKSDETFMQFGFGFRYKGWEASIRAVAILKKTYPNVFFTGLFSESPFNLMEHQIYYNELMELVDELGLQENVAIIRGYQSDAAIDSFMRTNRATVFPYVSSPEHEVFGASGAARLAMAKGVPVVTTSVNHFSDVPSIKADTPEQIAEELDKMFSDWKVRARQIDIQCAYLEENTWENIALRYVKLFESG